MQPIKPIRVMLVDDHRSVLWGLEKLIDGDRPRMEVVGKATSCAGAMELAERTAPDVVVLDLDLGGENACEIIPVLVNGGGTRVLIWTGMRDSRAREQSILRGASGLVQKEEPAETLLTAIDKVSYGSTARPPGASSSSFRAARTAPRPTPRTAASPRSLPASARSSCSSSPTPARTTAASPPACISASTRCAII